MMAGTHASSNQDETAAVRRARAAAEAEAGVGPSALRDVLYTPVNRGGDPDQIHESLERTRLALAATAERVLVDERRLGAITREYNAAHAAGRQPIDPAVLDDLRSRGRDVGIHLSGAGQPARPAQPAESAFIQRPTYSTPDKNLRAAEQIAIELEDLEGDERCQQTRRMRELLAAAKEKQIVAAGNPVARAEASRGTVRPIPEASQRPNASRQNRQLAQSRHESRVKSNRAPPPVISKRAEEPAVRRKRNDRPPQSEARPTISNRLGPRQIGQNDARPRIELLEKDSQ